MNIVNRKWGFGIFVVCSSFALFNIGRLITGWFPGSFTLTLIAALTNAAAALLWLGLSSRYVSYCGYIVREVSRDVWYGHYSWAGRAIRTWWQESKDWYPRWLWYKLQANICWYCTGHEHFGPFRVHGDNCPSKGFFRRQQMEAWSLGFTHGHDGLPAEKGEGDFYHPFYQLGYMRGDAVAEAELADELMYAEFD